MAAQERKLSPEHMKREHEQLEITVRMVEMQMLRAIASDTVPGLISGLVEGISRVILNGAEFKDDRISDGVDTVCNQITEVTAALLKMVREDPSMLSMIVVPVPRGGR